MRNKKSLKDGHHVLTVRFLPEEFEMLKKKQLARAARENRKVTYTEIVLSGVRSLSVR